MVGNELLPIPGGRWVYQLSPELSALVLQTVSDYRERTGVSEEEAWKVFNEEATRLFAKNARRAGWAL